MGNRKNETADISNEMSGSRKPKITSPAGNHLAAAAATLVQRHQLSGEGNIALYSAEMEKEYEAQAGRPQLQYGACGQKQGGSPPQAWLLQSLLTPSQTCSGWQVPQQAWLNR